MTWVIQSRSCATSATLGLGATLSVARSGSNLWRQLHPTGPRDGSGASALCAAIPVAQGLHRARDRYHSARVPGSCDHVQRSGAVPVRKNIHGILSRVQNTSLAGQGLAGAASRSVARSRTNRCYPASGRPPSPLRTARSLKTVVAVIVPADEVRRYRRFLALEVTNRY